MSRDDDRRLPARARQPLRLDRAAQPARLRRGRDLRGDGARASAPASASTTCRSTASRRRASPTGASAGSRSSSASSPAPPLAPGDLRRRRGVVGGGARGGRRRAPGAAAHRPLLPRPLRELGPLPRARGGPRRLRRRGRLPLRHRASTSCRRRSSRTSPRRATASTRSSRSTGRCSPSPTPRDAARPARGGRRARSSATPRQMIEPAMGEFEGLPALRRFADELRRLAAGARGLAVVRALLLPGDRAPRHGRRQLPADVLALPRGGRPRPRRRSPPRPRRGGRRWPARCWRRARPTQPDAALWSRDRRRGRGGARGRGAPLAGARAPRPQLAGVSRSTARSMRSRSTNSPGIGARRPSAAASGGSSRRCRSGRRRAGRCRPCGRRPACWRGTSATRLVGRGRCALAGALAARLGAVGAPGRRPRARSRSRCGSPWRCSRRR